MILCVILFALGMAAVSFISTYWDFGRRTKSASFRGFTMGLTFLTLAVVVSVVAIYKTKQDNQVVTALAEKVPVYPGASFVVHAGRNWLFDTKDQADVVVAYYERQAREKTAQIEKKDDFRFLVTMKDGKVMAVIITDGEQGAKITYILQ